MRFAALYDIHGNIDALDAVLEDVGRAGVDRIVIGGDIVWGPFPAQVLARLRDLDALWVRGNTDRDVAAASADGGDDTGDWTAAVDIWCAKQLDAYERRFLEKLPATVVVAIESGREALFCHGTPRSEDEIVTEITPEDDVAAVLRGVTQDLVVCGHTHSQFVRNLGAHRMVNAGSVGLPYEDAPGAYWAILGTDVTFQRTHYDVARAAERIRAGGFPAAEWFAETIASPLPRSEAISEFESRRAGS